MHWWAVFSCPSFSSHLVLPGTLLWNHESLALSLLVNSGADERGSHQGASQPRTILDLDGKPIAHVTNWTKLLTLVISRNHRGQIHLFLISSAAPAVRGSPWLACHNPQLDWANGSLTGWSMACHLNCIHSALSHAPHGSTQARFVNCSRGVP